MTIPDEVADTPRFQKILNRRINSWRASIACAGFIRLRIFSRRSRSIAASSRTSWLRAFHFEYLPAPMPSASSAETIQTVMSVEVTRSMGVEHRSRNVPPSPQSSSGTRERGRPARPFGAPPESFPKVSREARDTADDAPALPSNSSRSLDLTFLRQGGHFRRGCPHRERRCCVHWGLLRRCAADASTRGDLGESSGSISDRRNDSNSQTEKEKDRINLANCCNGSQARRRTCTRADAGFGRRAGTDRPRTEKARAQPEHGLNATKSKTGANNRTGVFCGRAGSSRRACRKETSIEETAATCCAAGGGDHFGARSGVAFGGTIHGNYGAVA